jgi:hypothetical protein
MKIKLIGTLVARTLILSSGYAQAMGGANVWTN